MAWLRSVLEKPVASILDSRVILADLDGKDSKGGAKKGLLARTLSTGAVTDSMSKSASAGESNDSAPSTIHLSADAKRSLAKLESLARAFLDSIFASAPARLPRCLRELCHHMQVESFKKFGDVIKLNRGEYSCCSSLVFLRFVCPAILSPHSFGLSKASPSPDVMRTLVLVSKVLTAAANGTTVSEPQLMTINALLVSVQARMVDFFNALCSSPEPEPAPAPPASGSVLVVGGGGVPASGSTSPRGDKFKALFASTPALRPERPGPAAERPPALPDVKRVSSINREERALVQVLSWAAKHAFTVQTSVREREDLAEAERAALAAEWDAFLAALMRLPPELITPQPRSSRTARSARGEGGAKESPKKVQQKEARKSRLLETIGDWLDGGSESRARKLRAKSEAAPRPATAELLAALETGEVSAWLVEMEKKGGDARQAVLYIYALLEETYRLRADLERSRPRASSRAGLTTSPSATAALASPGSPTGGARRSSLKQRRVHMNDAELLTSPRRLQDSTKERREREKKEAEREKEKERERAREREREREREKERAKEKKERPKERDEKEREREKEKEKEKKGKERSGKKEGDRDSERDKSASRIVSRSASAGPNYSVSLTPAASGSGSGAPSPAAEKRGHSRPDSERRRSVNYSPSVH